MNLNLSAATRWGLNGLLLLATVMALYLGQTVFIPTILALLLAAMLWPAATWLNVSGVPMLAPTRQEAFPWLSLRIVRVHVPWGLACMTVVAGLVTLALLITVGFGLAIMRMVQDLPTGKLVTRDVRHLDAKTGKFTWERERKTDQEWVYIDFRHKLEAISPGPLDDTYLPEEPEKSKVFASIKQLLDPDKPYIVSFLKTVGGYAASWLWEWILIMFLLLFLMVEGRMLSRRVVEIFGRETEVQKHAVNALADMAIQVRTYLVGRSLINFSVALTLGLVYYFCDLKQPWTWAILTSILLYVPYLGAIASIVPPFLDAFVSCDSAWVPVGILVFYTLLLLAEGYIVMPLVMGHSMELNATTVMLACLFWELVWGLSGLFLAMPLMAAIKAICAHVPDWQPWANLMSTREAELAERAEHAKAADSLGPRVDYEGKVVDGLRAAESMIEGQ